jgi:hypothetical protein
VGSGGQGRRTLAFILTLEAAPRAEQVQAVAAPQFGIARAAISACVKLVAPSHRSSEFQLAPTNHNSDMKRFRS